MKLYKIITSGNFGSRHEHYMLARDLVHATFKFLRLRPKDHKNVIIMAEVAGDIVT